MEDCMHQVWDFLINLILSIMCMDFRQNDFYMFDEIL